MINHTDPTNRPYRRLTDIWPEALGRHTEPTQAQQIAAGIIGIGIVVVIGVLLLIAS